MLWRRISSVGIDCILSNVLAGRRMTVVAESVARLAPQLHADREAASEAVGALSID
jgi:hypothetical protein